MRLLWPTRPVSSGGDLQGAVPPVMLHGEERSSSGDCRASSTSSSSSVANHPSAMRSKVGPRRWSWTNGCIVVMTVGLPTRTCR